MENWNPWLDADVRYQPGQQVEGMVTRIAPFGVFVQVEPGLEGVIYTFELGKGPSALAGLTSGQKMLLYIKSVDKARKRLELSLHTDAIPGLLKESEVPLALLRSKLPAEEQPGEIPLPQLARDERLCPACLRAIQSGWKYCVYCGGGLRRHCPACDCEQPELPGACYCYECGHFLST